MSRLALVLLLPALALSAAPEQLRKAGRKSPAARKNEAAWKAAFEAMKLEDWAGCEKSFAKLSGSGSREDDGAALFNRGVCAEAQGRSTEAAAFFAQSRKLDPDLSPLVAVKLGEATLRGASRLADDGKFAEAEAELRKVLAAEGKNPAAWTELAFLHARGRKLGDCVQAASKALALVKAYPEALLRRGGCLLGQGKAKEASLDFEVLLAAQPDHAEALVGRARAGAQLGRCKEARADAGRAAALDPAYTALPGSIGKSCR